MLWELNQEEKTVASVFFPLKGEDYYVGKDFPFFPVKGVNLLKSKKVKKVKIINNTLRLMMLAVEEILIKYDSSKNLKYINGLYFVLSGKFRRNNNSIKENQLCLMDRRTGNRYCSECSAELALCDRYNEDKYIYCRQQCSDIGGGEKEKRDCERMCLKMSIEGFRNCWAQYHECKMKCTPDPK